MNGKTAQWQQLSMSPPTPEWADRIASFLQSQTPIPLPQRTGFTRWKLCENEVRQGFASAMVTEPGNTIVSTCTVTPKRLWRKGTEQLWAEIGDTFTDAAYQRKGMFAALGNAVRTTAQEAGFQIIYGLPNDQALPGWLSRCGFLVKKDLVLDDFFAITSTKAIGLRTGAGRVPVLRRALCNPLVVESSRKLARLALSVISPRQREIRIEKEERFGPEFDQFWQKVRPTIANAQVRDARYLRWRYKKNPFSFVVLVARRGSELLGYVATLTLHHKDDKALVHTVLLDWLYEPSRESSVRKVLLFAAIKHAFEERADVISAVACRTSRLPLPFRHSGFVRRAHPAPVMFHGNEEGHDILADPSPWHFTLSDTDSF